MAAKDRLGKHGEQLATEFLQTKGMEILDRNWRCSDGEIDIIARDGQTMVVVEVKTRSGRRHGTAFESVTQDKVARLRHLGNRWLATQSRSFDALRVDVVALERFAGDFAVRHERGVR